jgi:hypothetical protein
VKFKVGDKVEWETCDYEPDRPRWDHGSDRGGSGEWQSGEITKVYDDFVEIDIGWVWPIEGNADYEDEQWDRPGYLRHTKSKPKKIRIIDMGSYYKSEVIEE